MLIKFYLLKPLLRILACFFCCKNNLPLAGAFSGWIWWAWRMSSSLRTIGTSMHLRSSEVILSLGALFGLMLVGICETMCPFWLLNDTLVLFVPSICDCDWRKLLLCVPKSPKVLSLSPSIYLCISWDNLRAVPRNEQPSEAGFSFLLNGGGKGLSMDLEWSLEISFATSGLFIY